MEPEQAGGGADGARAAGIDVPPSPDQAGAERTDRVPAVDGEEPGSAELAATAGSRAQDGGGSGSAPRHPVPGPPKAREWF